MLQNNSQLFCFLAWCDLNDLPFEIQPNDDVANSKIISQKKFRHLPLAPEMAQKLFQLSVGLESHPSNLVPEGGECSHGNAFTREHPILMTNNAKIITGSVILDGIRLFKLRTGTIECIHIFAQKGKKAYKRFVTGGACRCEQFYDGLGEGLLNVNNEYLISHTTLLDFFGQFTEG